jgi:hypothetical protein
LQQKRSDLRRVGVHSLEIDWLRAAHRLTLRRPLPNAPYFIFLSRAAQPERVEVWPLQLTQPIPIVPVPLRAPDADVPLDLSAAIRNIYDHAYYQLQIDYTQPPPKPAVSPAELKRIESPARFSLRFRPRAIRFLVESGLFFFVCGMSASVTDIFLVVDDGYANSN